MSSKWHEEIVVVVVVVVDDVYSVFAVIFNILSVSYTHLTLPTMAVV